MNASEARAAGAGATIAVAVEDERWRALGADVEDRCWRAAAAALGAAGWQDAGELSLLLTDDARVQTLNAAYRGNDAPTNVLAFGGAFGGAHPEPPADAPRLLGDVVLAYETVVPYTTRFIEFTREHEDLVIEIRTKSANWRPLEDVLPNDRCILAWTLSPPEVAEKYEKLTPTPEQRIQAIKQCMDRGWPVRLCFDPVLRIENWETVYVSFFKEVFKRLPAEKIRDVSLGVFRMNPDYFKRIKKQRTDSDILYYPFESSPSIVSYPSEERIYMIETLKDALTNYLPAEKIETWT